MGDHRRITDDDFLRNLGDYLSVLEILPVASVNCITVGGLSANPPMAKLLEKISETTRRDVLVGGTSAPPQEGAMPAKVLSEGGRQEAVVQPLEQPMPPAAASLETPQYGSPAL